MKKPMKDRVGDFMAGKGFYIVLFLCVAAIGISGYYLFSSMSGSAEPNTAVAGAAHVTVVPTPSPTVRPEKPSVPSAQAPVRPTTKPAAAAATHAPTPEPTSAPSDAATPTPVVTSTVFTWPVKGEIVGPFSMDTLVYDATMDDWRTHNGVDIAAEQGTQVLAVAGGTVTDIRQDDLMGTTLVIDHGNGMISTLSNLAAVPTVEIGDIVSTGDVIGSVGATAIGESALPSHLHLELTKDGLSTDPLDYLPGRT